MPNATVRANAQAMPKAGRLVGAPLPDDLAYMPDQYAMPVIGDCLAPEVRDGALLIFDKTAAYNPGDLVVVFLRSATPGEQPRALVKRLIMAPPSWVKAFPFEDHPESDVLALIGVEQINPQRRFTIRCAAILAIHKCLGEAPANASLDFAPIPSARKEIAQ